MLLLASIQAPILVLSLAMSTRVLEYLRLLTAALGLGPNVDHPKPTILGALQKGPSTLHIYFGPR